MDGNCTESVHDIDSTGDALKSLCLVLTSLEMLLVEVHHMGDSEGQ